MPFLDGPQGIEDTTNLNIAYSASSNLLTVTGTGVVADVLTDNTKYYVNYTLTATIDSKTGQFGPGSISEVVSSGPQAGAVMWNSQALWNFGYTFADVGGNHPEFDFEFRQSGPSILPRVTDGIAFGVIVYAQDGLRTSSGGTPTDFTQSFSGTGAKNDADIVPAPKTASAGVLLLMILGAAQVVRNFGAKQGRSRCS